MPYRPGGSASIDSITETIWACSFLATLPDTKMPRWPMSWCSRPTITCPRALISSVLPYTSATQLNACCGGVMLSPIEANRMIGTFISRRSNTPPPPVLDRARPQLVADEEILRDPLDLFAVHQIEAAPPALELEEARRLGVDVGEHVVVLVPERVRRVEVLEVLHQPGAVELASAQVRGERGEPGAARAGRRRSASDCRPRLRSTRRPSTTSVRR